MYESGFVCCQVILFSTVDIFFNEIDLQILLRFIWNEIAEVSDTTCLWSQDRLR